MDVFFFISGGLNIFYVFLLKLGEKKVQFHSKYTGIMAGTFNCGFKHSKNDGSIGSA